MALQQSNCQILQATSVIHNTAWLLRVFAPQLVDLGTPHYGPRRGDKEVMAEQVRPLPVLPVYAERDLDTHGC